MQPPEASRERAWLCPPMTCAGTCGAARMRFMVRMKAFVDSYRVLRGEFFHMWDDHRDPNAKGLGAFKDNASQSRIPCFFDGAGVVVLTHGFDGKNENNIDPREIAEAARIKREYEQRKALAAGSQVNVGSEKKKQKGNSFDHERMLFEFTEQLGAVMRAYKITRRELAHRLNLSAPAVTQSLRKGRNLTTKLMSEMAGACGYEVHVRLRRRCADDGPVYLEPEPDWVSDPIGDESP